MAKRRIFNRISIKNVLYVLVLLGAIGFGAYNFKQNQDLRNASPEKLQQAQADDTITAVGKLYDLPKNEKPDVATVKDKEALKKQYPFFDQAENNDVVLIYKDAKLAILYRPSTNRLVKVGPVNIESGLSIKTLGSDTERKAVEALLTANKLTFNSGGVSKTAVSGVIVVDLTGKNAEQAKRLAEIVKGTVGQLPAGEDKPADGDLLVIAGPAAQ